MAFISESEAQRFFDEEFYLENNPDVETAVNNNVFDSGFEHFLDFGISENRAPSDALTFFSEDDYLEDNPDVEQAVNAGTFESGLDHFLSFGVNELDVRGESTGYAFFNRRTYLNENRDVARAVEDDVFDSALDHYLEFGFSEGRSGLFTIGSAGNNLVTSEGETLDFTVESINGGSVGRDTEVTFSFAGDIDLDDIAGDSLTRTATIEAGSNSANVSVELAQDLTTEGLETISASASVLGDDSLETDQIIIQDTSTSPSVTGLTPNPITTINETDNSNLSFTIETENVSEGDTVNLNFSGDIDNDDVEGELPETATVEADGTATINLNFVADQTEEGDETFTLAASIGDEAVTSRTVTVEDTSLPQPEVTEVSASQTTVDETENNSLSFTIATENAEQGDTVDLSFGGTVTADDVEGDLPETATVGADGSASFSLTFLADQTEEGPETLTVSASIGDQQPVASDEVTVEDTSVEPEFDFEVEANDAGGVNVTVTSDEGVEIDSGIVSSAFPDIEGSDLSGPDNIVGAAGTDNLFGEGGNDTISGGQGSDFLVGGAGADSLDGGEGNDNVVGGAGDDTLNGGAGADTLNGGEGADTITLAAAAESSPDAPDTITGFVAGEDQIDLSAIGEDLTFGDNVTLQDGTLSGPGFAINLAELQGELSADDLIGVDPSNGVQTQDVGPEDDGSTFDATAADTTFDIATGNFGFTVNGFNSDDVLDVSDLNNPGVTVQPDSDQSDGVQSIAFDDPQSGNVVNVTLGGLTPEQDSAIFNQPTFVDEFGEDSLILS